MKGIELLLNTLHHGERALAREFAAVAEDHRAEHEVHHVATDLAAWSDENARQLVATAADGGLDLDGRADAVLGFPSADAWRVKPEKDGDSTSPLMLLRDLRDLHLRAACNSLHWEMLAQAGRASRNTPLLSLASSCHQRTLRQMRWTNTMIKTLSPQAVTSL